MNGTAGGRMKQGRFEMQGAEVTGRGFQGDSGHWADAGTHTELGKVGEGWGRRGPRKSGQQAGVEVLGAAMSVMTG